MMWVGEYVSRAAILGGCLVALVALELALPRGRPGWSGRLQAAVFWLIALCGSASTVFLGNWTLSALHVRPLIHARPPWPVALLLVPLLSDFFFYWFHRAQHVVPALWKLHAVHHSIRDLSAVNSYHHWTEELIRVFFVTLPATLLFRLDYALPAVTGLLYLQGYFLHAATTIHFGPLNRLIADNRTHRIHHSLEPRHLGKNFGSFSTLWDQLFGTAWFPKPDEWPATGLADRPELESITAYVLARSGGSVEADDAVVHEVASR